MAKGIFFPQLTPSSRTYTPGQRRSTVFESQNGATTLVEFGTQAVNATLQLQFKNIPDDDAALIIANYNEVVEDEWVKFNSTRALGGMETKLYNAVQKGDDKLRWRYDGPPQITSIYPGISTVSCKFVGYFYGA